MFRKYLAGTAIAGGVALTLSLSACGSSQQAGPAVQDKPAATATAQETAAQAPAATPGDSAPATQATSTKSTASASSGTSTTTMSKTTATSSSGTSTQGTTTKATPVTQANLPRHHDIRLDTANLGLSTVDTYPGDGQAPISPCMQFGWSKSKPNTIITREYKAGEKGKWAAASVASYATHAQAVAAAEAMGASLQQCGPRMVASNPDLLVKTDEKFRKLTLASGEPAQVVAVNATDGETGLHLFVTTGVTVTGTHVELVTMTLSGMQAPYDTRPMVETLNRTVKTLR